ncbi:MAG TPA: hypothetical protein VN821_07335 [Candidatus Udaeobacter sp.]|nr:hypothetical protein [Candidatus Udaeobacter sp.]
MAARSAALLAAGLMLGGCSWLSSTVAPASCPVVSKVGDAAKLIRFAPGGGQDLNNIAFEAGIMDITGGCVNVDNGLRVDMTADFLAAKGPADTEGKASFDYFVAIVGQGDKVLAREQFASVIPFLATKTKNEIKEPLEATIPVAKGQQGSDFHIFIGFALTPEELAYNRAHPGS